MTRLTRLSRLFRRRPNKWPKWSQVSKLDAWLHRAIRCMTVKLRAYVAARARFWCGVCMLVCDGDVQAYSYSRLHMRAYHLILHDGPCNGQPTGTITDISQSFSLSFASCALGTRPTCMDAFVILWRTHIGQFRCCRRVGRPVTRLCVCAHVPLLRSTSLLVSVRLFCL